MKRKKIWLSLLGAVCLSCISVGTVSAFAETSYTYYNQDGTELTWEYDANGVTTQAAYKEDGTKYGTNGMYSPANCYKVKEDGSLFVLASGAYTVFKPQDVTKEIEISFTMDPSNSWSGQDANLGRFFFAAYDNMDDAFTAGNNAWQGKNNEKFLAWGALKANDNQHKLLVSNQRSNAINYNGENAVFTIKVGETETEFFFGGEKFATTSLKRSDFASGQMYISFAAIDANLEAKVKVINCDHAGKTHADAKAATCTDIGNVEYYFCAQCGQYFADAACVKGLKANAIEIAALGHTEKTVAGKAATCTETGLTDGKKCTVCGVTTVAQEEIPASGHTEETVAGKAAT